VLALRSTGAAVRGAAFAISLAASCVTVVLSGLLAAALQSWFGVSAMFRTIEMLARSS
jgi:hypothetical protein